MTNEATEVLTTGQLNVGNNTNQMSAINALIRKCNLKSNSFVDNLSIFDKSVTYVTELLWNYCR